MEARLQAGGWKPRTSHGPRASQGLSPICSQRGQANPLQDHKGSASAAAITPCPAPLPCAAAPHLSLEPA